jgi:hypothetical protein
MLSTHFVEQSAGVTQLHPREPGAPLETPGA